MNARTLFSVCFALVVPLAVFAQPPQPNTSISKLHACDLITEALASTLFPVPLSDPQLNRRFESAGGAIHSSCFFRVSRNSVRTVLSEYLSEAEAVRAYSKQAVNTDYVSVQPMVGIGDVASWWKIGIESYGFIARKGNLVYVLEGRWGEQGSDARRKEQLKPLAEFAAKKLQVEVVPN